MDSSVRGVTNNIETGEIMTLDPRNACQYCGNFHGSLCPQVKAYTYSADGMLVRVEFFAPVDHIHPELLEAARRIVEGQS